MIRIDDQLLQELGLGSLPVAEKRSLQNHIYETLEMRVGMRLADQMSEQQLNEFEEYFEAKDDAGAFKWLETNFPNYKDIVQQEFDKLKVEVGQAAPQILAASQAAAAQQPVDAGQPQQAVPGQGDQPQVGQQTPPQPPMPGYQPPAAPAPAQPYAAPQFPDQQPPSPTPQQYPPFPDQQPPAGPGV